MFCNEDIITVELGFLYQWKYKTYYGASKFDFLKFDNIIKRIKDLLEVVVLGKLNIILIFVWV